MLSELRRSANLSQSELAAMTGISREFVSKLESGQRRPSPEVARRIAGVFGLSITRMWRLFYRGAESRRPVLGGRFRVRSASPRVRRPANRPTP